VALPLPTALAGEVMAGRAAIGDDLLPVSLEFFGDELGKPGERALPHFRAGDADHAGVVGLDHHPGIDLDAAVGLRLGHAPTGQMKSERERATGGCGADNELAARKFGGLAACVFHGWLLRTCGWGFRP